MIRINLLPHREEKRKARRQQFFALLGVVVVAAGLIWFLGHTAINGYIGSQQAKNEFLEKEIDGLKKEIAEISKLKDETDALLKRKQVIESLQGNRAETARMFDELLRRVPDGVRLVSFNQNNNVIDLTGESVSEARVSTLMRNLEESSMFQGVNPLEIRASTSSGGRSLFAFQLRMSIEHPAPANAKAGKDVSGKGAT
ncbi:MAG: PilN domain-containing protein [Proteobacteria bacterium]|nr:PilN domain-containing protein [Pseudomonadota bacterium]HQR05051.1 PilN domain-containing protein [Rhodocyclaceae bacterium]